MLEQSKPRNYLLLFAAVALSVATFFIGRSSMSKGTEPISGTTDTTKCGPCMPYNHVRPSSKIDLNLIRAMTSNYQLGPNGMGQTRSVWLSLEKIQQFVYDIQSNTCNCNDSNKLGVRIYFGDYPSQDQDWTNQTGFKDDLNNPNAPDGDFRAGVLSTSGTNTYLGLTSIIMVPTIFNGGKNVDFDPADKSIGCIGGYDTEKFIRRSEKSESDFNSSTWFLHSKSGITVTALIATNHGNACPPPPPGGLNCPANGTYIKFDH